MNIEPGKAAVRLEKLVPNPKARLRDQFHEVARFKYFSVRLKAAPASKVARIHGIFYR